MVRRRSLPWIYIWSRHIIGAIAILGAILTAYLTIIKFTGGDTAFCSAEAAQSGAGCGGVLNSVYAEVFGLPLSLFGFLAYTSMAISALGPLAINRNTNKLLKNQIDNWSWFFLLIGSFSMTVFSGYLMYVLAFELKTLCFYCIGSALFSLSLLVLTIMGREWEDIGQIFFTGIIVAMVTLVGTLGVYANVNSPNVNSPNLPIVEGEPIPIPLATGEPIPPIGWEINTSSSEAEIALAKHLTAVGAKKYGAFWCPHCYEQKQLFGAQAFKEIDYIECAPQGKNPQPQVCRDAGIRSFPSWEINGELYPGVQLLSQLAELSDYQGNTEFKYSMRGLR